MNETLLRQMNGLAGRSEFLDRMIVFFAEDLFVAATVAVVALILLALFFSGLRRVFRGNAALFLYVLLAVFVSRSVTEVIRYFYQHPRPFEALGNVTQLVEHGGGDSFPSGHAAIAFAAAAAVIFSGHKLGWRLFFIAALVGAARVIAGVHWPFDVVGGAATGVVSAWFIRMLMRRMPRMRL